VVDVGVEDKASQNVDEVGPGTLQEAFGQGDSGRVDGGGFLGD